MSNDGKRILKNLKAEVGRDLDQYVDDLMQNLRTHTPIATGNARRNWVKKFDKRKLGNDSKYTLARNDVEYIERLDEGWSGQAPRGIVEPAVKRTRKKR